MEKNIKKLLNVLTKLKMQQKDLTNIMLNSEFNQLVGGNKYYDASPCDIPEIFKKKMIAKHELLPMSDNIAKAYKEIIEVISSLNEYSENTVQNKELEKIKIAQAKDLIDTKEFELLYSYGKEAQKGYRGRIQNPLPYIQKSLGSKILYKKIDIEKWLTSK